MHLNVLKIILTHSSKYYYKILTDALCYFFFITASILDWYYRIINTQARRIEPERLNPQKCNCTGRAFKVLTIFNIFFFFCLLNSLKGK